VQTTLRCVGARLWKELGSKVISLVQPVLMPGISLDPGDSAVNEGGKDPALTNLGERDMSFLCECFLSESQGQGKILSC
jgi:hypothetical protein